MTLDRVYIEEYIEMNDYYNNYEPDVNNGNTIIGIYPTATLEVEADKVIVSEGFKPLFDRRLPDESVDLDGWYDFYLVMTKDRCEQIYFEVINTEQDVQNPYEIPTDELTRILLYERIVDQFGRDEWEGFFKEEE